MKKLLSNFTIMMLVAAMALTSCDQQQAENENEVPLKVTYVMECSRDLLDLCDVVITYKGDDEANAVDTIKAAPTDSTETKTWTKTVGTHKIPVKIGLDYTFVQKADTLPGKDRIVRLTARGSIIAEKIGVRQGIAHMSEKTINSKTNFFDDFFIMDENIVNTPSNLATIIDVYNDRQAYKRGTTNSNTCFIVKMRPNGNGSMSVKKACWNVDSIGKEIKL